MTVLWHGAVSYTHLDVYKRQTQEKYITISVVKKDVEEARAYFSRVGADLISHFAALGSKCVELDASEKMCIRDSPR